MKHIILFSAGLLLSTATRAQNIITTVAGGGSTLGDGGPATDAQLLGPTFLCLDTYGNIYISDGEHNRIRKIDSFGIISTIAGTGLSAYNGDNIQATSANIYFPRGIAIDSTGNIYFTDNGHHRIRKINKAGLISTIAGIDSYGYNADNIPATNAELNFPCGITFDKDKNIIFCDGGNNRIRKIDSFGYITTISGIGSPGYNGDNCPATIAKIDGPYDIVTDCIGDIYFSDSYNNRIRKIDSNGIISTIAGTGISGFSGDHENATSAKLNFPTGITTDCSGNLFFSDGNNQRVRLIKQDSSGIINTIVGTGIASYNGDNISPLTANVGAIGLAKDKMGNLYISDYANGRVRFIKNTTSIDQININYEKVELYPNPNNGILNVFIHSRINHSISIKISSSKGQVVSTLNGFTNENEILKIDPIPGVYIITGLSEYGMFKNEFIVE